MVWSPTIRLTYLPCGNNESTLKAEVLVGMEHYPPNKATGAMEDETWKPLRSNYDFPLDLETFINVALAISQLLVETHQQQIMLGYISPDNLYINNQNRITFVPPLAESFDLSVNQRKTLAYISPEQTGRTNRQLDQRSDFYSLGVTLYEMITGVLPFQAHAPGEWVYSHIARAPLSPCCHQPDIPPLVADIILKLMAKEAEERYQTARGLQADLEKCLQILLTGQETMDFPLGQADWPDRLLFPQKLYGRSQAKEMISHSVEKVYAGQSQILLITGMAGIGKTSLIHEVNQTVSIQGGVFISAKFEQYKKDIPYSAIIMAFKDLLRQLLMLPKQSLELWKNRITGALGNNGQVIVDVIPELSLIIGPQQELPVLGLDESKNRFNLVFQNFVKVFTQAGLPLVIFIDDLQFADLASLKLMENLLAGLKNDQLLLIGAYRDNELDPFSPLLQIIEEIKSQQIDIININLDPLKIEDIREMLRDMLICPQEDGEIAALIQEKTLGNPFFIHQFIHKLFDDHILEFSYSRGCWTWDMEKAAQARATDNVIDLLLEKIRKLGPDVQNILTLAACIGLNFNLETLSIIARLSPEKVEALLNVPVAEGLVSPARDLRFYPAQSWKTEEPGYHFLHDRIQEAAYHLLSEEASGRIHLNIARLLLTNASETTREEQLFTLVNHFNLGLKFVTEPTEQRLVAHLNYQAGLKAKSSTAYSQALKYLNQGRQLLPSDIWENDYPLAYALHKEAAECEYLAGNHSQAEELFAEILKMARSSLDKAEIYSSRICLYISMGKFLEANQIGVEALQLFDLQLHAPQDIAAINQEIPRERELYQQLIAPYAIEDLIHLPEMTDPEEIICADILVNMLGAAFVSNPPFLIYLGLKSINYTLQHGVSQHSTYTLAAWGLMLGAFHNDYKSGHDFGRLAMQFNKIYNYAPTRCNIPFLFAFYINPWRRPIQESFVHLQDAFQMGVELGDYVYAGFSAHALPRLRLAHGHQYLPDLLAVIDNTMHFFTKIKNQASFERQDFIKHVVLNLLGYTSDLTSFSDDQFDEKDYIEHMVAIQYGTGIALYYYYKAIISFTYEFFEEALQASQKAVASSAYLINSTDQADCFFYHSLSLAACFPNRSSEQHPDDLEQLQQNLQRMQFWAENSPANYEHKYLLMRAELARLQGD